jgi:hypothetical protein
LDYLNSSCPRLLLEPQRTNLFLWSEQLGNWGGSAAGTLLSNAAISPDGYQNADVIQATDGDPYRYQNITYTGTVTFSVYVKGIGTSIGKQGDIRFGSNVQVFTLTGSWQRVSVTAAASGSTSYGIETINPAAVGEQVAVWGAQVEAGAYATSYIPTLGAAVTRGADAALKTSISSLIGQDEGTIFVEFEYNYSDSTTQVLFKANQTTDANSVGIEVQGTTIKGLVNSAGGNIATITGTIATGTIKAALAYKTNDMAFYVNGTQVGVDTSGSIAFAGVVDILTIGQFLLNGGTFFPASRPFNQALVFKTRLSNSSLASLTSL